MWLIKESTLQAILRGREALIKISAEQVREFEHGFQPTAEGMPRNLKVAGDVAEIRVEGVLTKKPDFWSWLFGGGNTTYEQIQQALAICAADTSIKRVRLYVDSPGGHVDGLFDTLAAIDSFAKPKSVTAAFVCSAAYAIAAVAGRIEATNAAVEVGSIGVAVRFVSYADVENIDITSTEAPDKRPDPKTEEGKAVIRRELDAIHELFVDAIAHGRGTTVDRVNAEFGRGATLLAGEAKRRKMIDRIAKPALRAIEPSTEPEDPDPLETSAAAPVADSTVATMPAGNGGERTVQMDLNELKTKHADIYAAVLAEGEKEGASKERKRVLAHLKLADSTGATKVARDAIESGASTMDEGVHADYLSAAMNRRDATNRAADDKAAGEALDNADKPIPNAGGAGDVVDQGVDKFLAKYGKKAANG